MPTPYDITKQADRQALQAAPFRLDGICHLGIEDDFFPTAVFREFLTVSDTFAAKTLEVEDAAISVDFTAVRRALLSGGESIIAIVGQLRTLTQLKPGIVLKLALPKCTPNGESGHTACYAHPRTAFVYGETYEQAINQAASLSEQHQALTLAGASLLYERGQVVSPNLLLASLGRTIIQSIRDALATSSNPA